MKQKIKNIFSVSSKKALGKLGLFLVFGFFVMNVSIFTVSEEYNKTFSLGFTSVSAGFTDWWCETWYSEESAIQACKTRMSDPSNLEGYLNTPGSTVYNRVSENGGVESYSSSGTLNPVKWILWGVLEVLGILLRASGQLLDFVSSLALMKDMIGNEKIYLSWAFVRDILNMFFMMLLLFSAFATIFQVEKYHLRKVIIMLIVMALLVNFSYPISIFVIDFSNSAMYFLKELAVGSNGNISANIMYITNFGSVLGAAVTEDSTVTVLLLYIIFFFILFITIFSIALNLLIRVVIFAVLIILAPAGFAFAFFPDTKSVANSWWSALFKYAFLGPIMMFFLYLSLFIFKISRSSSAVGYFTVEELSIDNTFVPLIIPVVFLWIGLIFSQKFGGSGAGVAMNIAKKTGNKIKGYSQTLAWGGTKMIGRGVDMGSGYRISGGIGGLKSKWDSWGDNYKSKSERKKTEAADFLGVKGANEKLVQESRKKWKEAGGISDSEMARIDSKKFTKAEKMALALERAETKGFDKDPAKAATQYREALNALKDNKVYKDLFDSNIRKKNIDLVINEEIVRTGATGAAVFDIAEREFAKLNSNDWKEQNIERIVSTASMPGNSGIIGGATDVINGYSTSAKARLSSEMRKDKYGQGQKAGLWA